jgi:hypothetical protein
VIEVPVEGPHQAVGDMQRDAPDNVRYVPVPVRKTQTISSVKSAISFGVILRDAGLTASSIQNVKITVSKSNKKVCKVSGKTVKTLTPGTCLLKVTVTAKTTKSRSLVPISKAWVIKVQ